MSATDRFVLARNLVLTTLGICFCLAGCASQPPPRSPFADDLPPVADWHAADQKFGRWWQ